MNNKFFVWMKKLGEDWVCASIELSYKDAINHAGLARRAYLRQKRWKVSKDKPK